MPVGSLCTLAIPIWILGLVSLAIYAQDFELAEKVASVATMMVAYVAYFPVVRG